MCHLNPIFLRLFLAFSLVAICFGIIGPALVSSKSDVGVTVGLVYITVTMAALWYLLQSVLKVPAVQAFLKNAGLAIVITAMACGLSACGDDVPVGHVGIKVHMLGGSKGVDQEVLTPGRYWMGWNEKLYTFPTFTQNYVWDKSVSKSSPDDESITFQTVEGLAVNGDFGITYSLEPEKVPALFQRYRAGVKEITNVYLHNMVRDALVEESSTKPVDYIYGAGKADLIRAVKSKISAMVSPMGIKIDNIYLIGEFRLPPSVVEAINAKIGATQKAMMRENEVAQAKAEANKKIEEARGLAESMMLVAEAQATSNRKVASSLTPALIKWQALEKWNGELPRFTGKDAVPFIDVTN